MRNTNWLFLEIKRALDSAIPKYAQNALRDEFLGKKVRRRIRNTSFNVLITDLTIFLEDNDTLELRHKVPFYDVETIKAVADLIIKWDLEKWVDEN